jgi:biopolymer transport protein ExbD
MLFRPPKPVCMTLNLAPMVDVMMCLIIFFLLGSSLVLEETRPLELPHALAAAQIELSDIGSRVVINVRPSAADDDQADFVVVGWDGRQIVEQRLDPDELERHLLRVAAASPNLGEVRCVIRADREVAFTHVERVLRSAGLAKIGRIVFAANPGADPHGGP